MGSVIKNVNGKTVSSLEDFRKAVKNDYLILDGKKMIYLRLEDKNQVIIDLSEAFLEEETLTQRYKYNISKLYLT
jgi:hypothetical protein